VKAAPLALRLEFVSDGEAFKQRLLLALVLLLRQITGFVASQQFQKLSAKVAFIHELLKGLLGYGPC